MTIMGVISDLEMSRNAAAAEFLRTHKTAYSFSFRYNGSEYWQGFFDSQEAMEDAQVRHLKAIGYKPRKFWQFWRNDETKPSKRVLKRLVDITDSA